MSEDREIAARLQEGAAVVRIGGAGPKAPARKPDKRAAFGAFQRGQLAMDRGAFDEALACFREACAKDWTETMYRDWLNEARSRLREGQERTEDPPTADTTEAPTLAMPSRVSLAPELTLSSQPTEPPAEYEISADEFLPRRELKAASQQRRERREREEEARRLAESAERERTLRLQREKSGERYYHRGVEALNRGELDEAVACFEGAMRSVPDSAAYRDALRDAKLEARKDLERRRRAEERQLRLETADEPSLAPKPERAPQAPPSSLPEDARTEVQGGLNPRLLLGGLAAAALLGAVALAPGLLSDRRAEALEEVREMGLFQSIELSERGFQGTVEEPLLPLAEPERKQHCRELASLLPGGGPLLLTSAEDGHTMVCRGD